MGFEYLTNGDFDFENQILLIWVDIASSPKKKNNNNNNNNKK